MTSWLTLNDGGSSQVLAMLLSEGDIEGSDIRAASAEFHERVKELRAKLRRLKALKASLAKRTRARRPRRPWHKATKVSPARWEARRVSPERRKTMQRQGRYLGAIRQLRPADRAKVKGVRAEKGFAAAIAEARRLMRGQPREG
jgi:hypothetical protein